MTVTLADRTDLEGLPAIGLAELVTHAELLVRMDRKYLLDDDAVSAFLRALPVGTRVLEIDGQRTVGYRSLYHDTSGLDAYRATAQRRRRRFKVRTREYGTGGTYLEVKTRRGLFTIKERIEYESVAGQLDASGLAYVSERLADAGIPLDHNVQPTLWTVYCRTTLLLPDEARVTVDSDLVWSDMEADSLQCDGLTIVETKSGRSASAADRVLWAAGHRPVSLSKYARGSPLSTPTCRATGGIGSSPDAWGSTVPDTGSPGRDRRRRRTCPGRPHAGCGSITGATKVMTVPVGAAHPPAAWASASGDERPEG